MTLLGRPMPRHLTSGAHETLSLGFHEPLRREPLSLVVGVRDGGQDLRLRVYCPMSDGHFPGGSEEDDNLSGSLVSC